jgi:hypothetical protein
VGAGQPVARHTPWAAGFTLMICMRQTSRVVQDTATKKCTIVDKKPTTTTTVQVGPVAFKTRTEAEAGMKTITVCSSN